VLNSNLPDEDLVCACAASKDHEVWEAFIDRFQPLIAGAVYRAVQRNGGASGEVEELVQGTYLKLYDPKRNVLGRFQPRHPGSARAFLRAVTIHFVADYFKNRRSERSGSLADLGDENDVRVRMPETRAGSALSIEQDVFQRQVDAILLESESQTKQRDRQIFWFHYRHGMTAREISELPWIKLETKGVEAALFRLIKLLRARMVMSTEEMKGTRTAT